MMRLFDFLFPPRTDETVLRRISDDGFSALMAPRLTAATRPGTIALLSFGDARVRAAVHEAKYHGTARALDLLARTLADYLRDSDEQARNIAIVPIPLGRIRMHERGFNQAEEVVRRALLALDREGAHPFSLELGMLLRTRETASQVSLPRREREENMRGAFSAAHPADPARTYIVLDDVVTTGATLQAAIDALHASGAEHIVPLALAH